MFERYQLARLMGEDAPAGGGKSAAAVDTGNVDMNDLVNQVVSKRVKKAMEKAMADLRGDLMSVVKDAMGQKPADARPADPAQAQGNQAPDAERLNLKVMDERFKSLQDRLEKAERARQEAESSAKDARMRSEVHAKLASKLGPDHPMLDMLMDSLYDKHKRFIEESGQYGVRFPSKWGADDELKPLEEGIAEMFDPKNGELRHLVSQSKVERLPPSGFNRPAIGSPFKSSDQMQQQIGKANPLLATIAEGIASERPEAAALIMHDAMNMASINGAPKSK